jgi:hypothetical protein
MKRRDLLAECMQPGTPIDVMAREWCARCLNPECSRSAMGQSKFETRVQDWEEKLFKDPPKLAPDDPRFAQIIAHKFITIDVGRTPEIRSDWLDPRDLKEPEPPTVHSAQSLIVVPPLASPPPVERPSAPSTPVARTVSPPSDKDSPRSGATLALVGANAPDQGGRILRGSPTGPNNKVDADPWAPPEPPDPSDQIVQPGATIKMGQRSGV